MTLGSNLTSGNLSIGSNLTTGSISLAGSQTTGDIFIGTNSSSDIYIGNVASGSTTNTGICHINKLQIASGSVFRSVLFGTVLGGSGSNTVAFGQTLPAIPLVVATILNNSSLNQVFSISIVPTTTGFTYYKNFIYTDAVTAGGQQQMKHLVGLLFAHKLHKIKYLKQYNTCQKEKALVNYNTQ